MSNVNFDYKREYSMLDVLSYMLKLEYIFKRLDISNKFSSKLYKRLMFCMFIFERKFSKFFDQTPDGFSKSDDDEFSF